ncbi:hypothetical protein BBJ28_00011510, partial [Nothophytophthora sp. Chile5]
YGFDQSNMELMDAIEELERSPAASAARPTAAAAGQDVANRDFVEAQVVFVQQRLQGLWRGKHRDAEVPKVPFYWVFSKLLRLIEEYPDGLTEAVVVTELMTLLQKEFRDAALGGATRMMKNVRGLEDMSDLLEERESDALQARVMGYDNHRLTIELDGAKDVALHIAPIFPFQSGRAIAFTNAKLLERKEVGTAATKASGAHAVKFALLPTAFLVVGLDEQINRDRRLLADAFSLSQVDQMVTGGQEAAVIQQLVLKAKVLDIGAIRPCQTSLYVHRQVVLLGEASPPSSGVSLSAASNTQWMAQASHAMVLWDDQVALSRLFKVGDTLALFHPFVHVCEPQDSEIVHILNEYSSQQRCAYYFEYGSATVLFRKSAPVSSDPSPSQVRSFDLQSLNEQEKPLSRLEAIQAGWRNFSLYAHVRSITVSHGVPLLAAFFYAYYDPKTNQPGANAVPRQHPPALDRAIVSKYYLVVMLHVYTASSNRLLTIEVTGANALTALRLVPGQSIFLDGLVAVDLQQDPLCSLRDSGRTQPASAPSPQAEAIFAFPTRAYYTSSSSVVALCSDWESIFGKQSLFSESAKLTVVNTMPGLPKTALGRQLVGFPPRNVANYALTIVQMNVAAIGWLVPSSSGSAGVAGSPLWTCDSTCEKGYSTTCAHKPCRRPVEMASGTTQRSNPTPPKWKCGFCQEIFFGMEDTMQTFCELAVTLEDGRSQGTSVVALCQGEVVESLLGLTAEDYAQLRLIEKREALERVVGNDFRLLLSRCVSRRVAISAKSAAASPPRTANTEATTAIQLRVDLVQPLDTFVAARLLLEALSRRPKARG